MKRFTTITSAIGLALALSFGCGGEDTTGGTGSATGAGPATGAGTGAAGTAATSATDTGAPAAGGYTAIEVKDGGTIKGVVKFDGTVPTLPDIPTSKNPEFCGAAIPNHRLEVDKATSGLSNTVVYLADIKTGSKLEDPSTDAKIDQAKCEYHPHVSVVPAGTKLSIINSDDILHNVHAYSLEGKDIFNFGMPSKGMTISNAKTTLSTPGMYQLKCDAGHVWMNAYIFVKAHPYVAVTGADGSFTFTNVPPGTYTVKAWHAGWTATVGADAKTVDYAPAVEVEGKVEVKPATEATVELKIGGAA